MFIVAALLLAFNIIFLAIVYILLTKKIRYATTDDSLLKQISEGVNEIINELNMTTDRNISILEEKIGNLSKLIDTADNRIKVLKKELDKNSPQTYSDLKPKIVTAVLPSSEKENRTLSKVSEKNKSFQRSRLPAFQEPVDEKIEENYKETIVKLAKQGLDAKLIAAKVAKPLGEVQLVISLHKEE